MTVSSKSYAISVGDGVAEQFRALDLKSAGSCFLFVCLFVCLLLFLFYFW